MAYRLLGFYSLNLAGSFVAEEREARCMELTGIIVNILWVEIFFSNSWDSLIKLFTAAVHNMVPFDAGFHTITKIALIVVIATDRVACSLQITVSV